MLCEHAKRRRVMKSRILTCITAMTLFAALAVPVRLAAQSADVPKSHNEWTVAQLQAAMAAGKLTSEELTKEYIARIIAIDQNGPGVNSVIELNPDALVIAHNADVLRKHGIVLGPLHGKPALIDSTVAENLRNGGAVILGQTNLSEWANFRSFESISGWSGWGGQTNNPYGIARNPCGSSAGSAAAVSSNFTAGSFGTETDGSIVCPANANGVVGLKPTVG